MDALPRSSDFVRSTVCVLLFLLVAVSMTLGVLAQSDLRLFEGPLGELLRLARGHLISYAFVVISCAVLYKVLPYQAPTWMELLGRQSRMQARMRKCDSMHSCPNN